MQFGVGYAETKLPRSREERKRQMVQEEGDELADGLLAVLMDFHLKLYMTGLIAGARLPRQETVEAYLGKGTNEDQ